MRTKAVRTGGAALAGIALGALLAGAALAETTGEVLSARGEAHVQGPEGRRSLDCGEPIREGERVVTGSGGDAALGVGDLYVQVGPGAVLRLGPQGELLVERGLVRVVDLGEGGGDAAARVRTPHAVVRGSGVDAEIRVEASRSEVCEGLGRLRVGRVDASGSTRVEAGQCGIVEPTGITVQPRGAERLALSGAEGCVDVAIATHFQPTDVAAPPPSLDLFPLDPDKRTFNACEANGCGGGVQVRTAPTPPTPPQPPGFGFGTGPADPPGLDFGTGPAPRPGGNGPS